jgi:hypothetical protein
MALGFTQPLTEISCKKCFWGVKHGRHIRPHCHLWADCLENMPSLTLHNPISLHCLLMGTAFSFLLKLFLSWGETESIWYISHSSAYCTIPKWWWWWWWSWSNQWNDLHGKPMYFKKTFPCATLPTTNLLWPDPGSNPGLSGGKPVTNRLRYGMTILKLVSLSKLFWMPTSSYRQETQESDFSVKKMFNKIRKPESACHSLC